MLALRYLKFSLVAQVLLLLAASAFRPPGVTISPPSEPSCFCSKSTWRSAPGASALRPVRSRADGSMRGLEMMTKGAGKKGGMGKRAALKDNEEEPSTLSRLGSYVGTAWNLFVVGVTVTSVVLAVDSFQKLRTQPLTLDTLLPTIGNLLPLASLGYFSVLRLVGVVVRLLRIALTIPILAGGAYLMAPQLPSFLKDSPDVAAGSFFALLATPEVLEALAVLAIVASLLAWTIRTAVGVGSGLASWASPREETDEDNDSGDGDFEDNEE
ncbi:unnamed protein product [Phaeothamnion confervicola]